MTLKTLPRSKTTDGIAYNQSGNGLPIILIHGVGLRSESWYQQIEVLKNDYTVFAVDMPGHGESDNFKLSVPTLIDYTDRLATFIKTVVDQPVIIVGHSMGALLSLNLAAIYPELCLAIVPMNAVYKRSNKAQIAIRERAESLKTMSQADATAPVKRWFDKDLSTQDIDYAEMCRSWLLKADLKGYATAYNVFSEENGIKTKHLKAFNIPTLFLTGELDVNSTPDMTKAMSTLVRNSEFKIIPNSRHMMPLTHAIEVNNTLLDFLVRRLPKTLSAMNEKSNLNYVLEDSNESI